MTITARTSLKSEGRTYELDKKLGGGGFGEVWRARLVGSAGFTKTVAVKLLHAQADVPAADRREYEQRLRDEARLLGALKHRAIVFAEDLVELDGRPALVMELVEGDDLEGLMRIGPVPPRVMAEIAAEVASALAVAHGARDPVTGREMGLVHRDIKPGNIRIGPRGDVKVLDFGIAFAHFDRREAKTQSNLFFTQGYYPPERVRLLFELEGELPPEQSTTDIYALGVVIAEALTGKRVKLSIEVERHEARRRELAASLPHLGDLVSEMLSEDPAARPTATEVEDRLVELAATLPGPALRRWAPDTLRRLAEMSADTGASELGQPPPLPSAPSPAPASPGKQAAAPDAQPERAGRRGAGLWLAGGAMGIGAAALILVFGAAGAGYYFWSRGAGAPPPTAATATAAPATETRAGGAPETARAGQTATTMVAIQGDAVAVTAKNGSSTVPLPGRLVPGTWTVSATFSNQATWSGDITVSGPTTIRCGSGRSLCWIP